MVKQEIDNKLAYELELKQYQLSSLLEITQAINQNFSREQLFSIYKFVLRSQLKIPKCALFVYEKQWSCPVIYGVDPSCAFIDVEKEMMFVKGIHNIEPTTTSPIKEFETVIPVFHKSKPLAYALIGKREDGAVDAIELRSDLIPFLQTLTNVIIVAIENKKFASEQIRQEGIKKEMELAAQMQSMLFPVTLPNDEQLEMHAAYLPHQEVGGDYYDCIRLSAEETVFCLADVSGKGIAAALLMANFQANLHALVPLYPNLAELVIQLNTKVNNSAKGEKFITFFIGKINTHTKEINYINAGHNAPLFYSMGKVQQLSEGTTGLGMFSELLTINSGKVKFGSEFSLLCYTDGVVETENSKDEAYGTEQLTNYFVSNVGKVSPKDFNHSLIAELTAFKGRRKFPDDITLLFCKYSEKSRTTR